MSPPAQLSGLLSLHQLTDVLILPELADASATYAQLGLRQRMRVVSLVYRLARDCGIECVSAYLDVALGVIAGTRHRLVPLDPGYNIVGPGYVYRVTTHPVGYPVGCECDPQYRDEHCLHREAVILWRLGRPMTGEE